jgi:hypothetical protein
MHINIRSVNKNFMPFTTYLQTLDHTFDIIGVSETWLNETSVDNFKTNCYNTESIYRSDRIGGGVSLLIKDSIQYYCKN